MTINEVRKNSGAKFRLQILLITSSTREATSWLISLTFSCSLDVVTEYSCSTQTNDTECFLTEIRRYAHQSQNDVVWLHCTVIACLSSSLCQTLCADCPTDRRRKRSTTELANQNEAIIYQLHSGPYRIVGMEEGPTHFSGTTTITSYCININKLRQLYKSFNAFRVKPWAIRHNFPNVGSVDGLLKCDHSLESC